MDFIDAAFPTLFSKTFAILTLQLFITWVAVKQTIDRFHLMHAWGTPWISSTKNEQGQIDLHIDFQSIRFYFYGLLVVDIAVFLLLLFWGQYQTLWISTLIFSVWSILTGIEVALCLLSVDENLGSKVLAITTTIVFATGAVGIYSNIDFGFLGVGLFIALLFLIVFNLVRLFVAIPRPVQRWVAGIGVVIFTLYLVHDFNALTKASTAGMNDWQAATRFAIEIYLDIINLFLELLDAMSD